MSSFELNKIAGAILLAGVIAMLASTFSYIFYHPKDAEKRGYSVEVAEEGGADAAAKEPVEIDLAALLQSATVDKGMKVAKKCASCHSFEKGGATKTGPNLYGLIGGARGAKPGYTYSKVFAEMGGGWDYKDMHDFLAKPRAWAPGTKMAFVGIKKPEDRAAIIKYLRSLSDSPAPLPDQLIIKE